MATIHTLTDRVHDNLDIPLIFDAATNTVIQQLYGADVDIPGPDVLYHEPETGERRPVRARDLPRMMFFRAIVGDQQEWDTAFDRAAAMRRWFGTASSQALRHSLDGDVLPVYLKQQWEGAENATYHRVVGGWYDDYSHAYDVIWQNDKRTLAIVALELAPAGEIEDWTPLHNELSNPAFLVESGTAGLAAGWNLIGTPPDYGLDPGSYLIQQSQWFEASSTATAWGVQSDAVSIAPGTYVRTYAWVRANTASDDVLTVLLRDIDAAIDVDTATLNPSSPDSSYLTAEGPIEETWYRVPVEGVITGSSYRIQVYRAAVDASAGGKYWVDLAYAESDPWTQNHILQWRMDLAREDIAIVVGWEWTSIGGGGRSVQSVHYFSAEKSQQMISSGNDAGDEVVIYYEVQMPPDSNITFSVWLKPSTPDSAGSPDAGVVELYEREFDVRAVINSVAFDESLANATETDTGDDADTWGRFEVSGSNAQSRTVGVAIRVQNPALNEVAVAYVDDVVLMATRTPLTTVWSDHSTLANYRDVDASNPDRDNSLLVWWPPGDMPALCRYHLRGSFASARRKLIAGRCYDGRHEAIDQPQWYEAEDFDSSSTTNGAFTKPSDAARSGGSVLRFTASGGIGSGAATLLIDGKEARRLLAETRNVYALVHASHTDAEVTLDTKSPYGVMEQKTGQATQTADYEVVDLGTLAGMGVLPEARLVAGGRRSVTDFYPIMTLEINVAAVPDAATVDIDALWFVPKNDEYLVAETNRNWNDNTFLYVYDDGVEHGVVNEQSGQFEGGVTGTLYQLQPGQLANRVSFLVADANGVHDPADELDVTLYVLGRTRHLMGRS